MESQPQNPEFRINPENLHPCGLVEIHQRQCNVSLSKTLYPLLSTGSNQENRNMSQHD